MNVDELSVPQKLAMIGVLWDSIPDSLEALPVPEWHQQELERRLAEADADPGAGIPWEQVKRRVSSLTRIIHGRDNLGAGCATLTRRASEGTSYAALACASG